MRIRQVSVALATLALASAAVAQVSPVAPGAGNPFDQAAFEAHAKSKLAATEADIEAFREQCTEESVPIAAETLVRRLASELDAALTSAEDGEPRAALELAVLLKDDAGDRVVQGFARYHLARVFIDNNEADKALTILREFQAKNLGATPLDAEAAFYRATAYAEIPEPGDAAIAFGDFLRDFPDAPERYRTVAAQRKGELELQWQDPLHEIADDMKRVQRDLGRGKTDDPVKDTQIDIVERLQKVIEEMEQQSSSSGPASGNSQSSAPANKSTAPDGQSRTSLSKAPGAGEEWRPLKDEEREAIESEVATKLPGHYKKLLQDYYDRLGRGSSRGGR